MNATFRRFAPAAAASSSAVALIYLGAFTSTSSCQEKEQDLPTLSNEKRPKLVFLGTGSSTGCPKPLCSMLFQDGNNLHETTTAQHDFAGICRVSNMAIQGDPKHNKDYRNNPSLLISHVENNQVKNIIIDVGKTFREGALRWMPFHSIQSLNAIVLTHHHMDAVAGLDDVRGFQQFTGLNDPDKPPTRIPISVHLSRECLNQVSSQFPWLFPNNNNDTITKEPIVKRDVAALQVNIVQDYIPFEAAGLEMTALPVLHGSDLISRGFSFSIQGHQGNTVNIIYISDISEMVPDTMKFIQEKLGPTDILIVDCLLPEFTHPVHYSLEQAVALAQDLQAKQTYLIGMSCDAFPSHDVMNAQLSKRFGGTVQFAYDGQVLYL